MLSRLGLEERLLKGNENSWNACRNRLTIIKFIEAMFMKELCVVNNVIRNKDVINNEINGYVSTSKDQFVKLIEMYRDDQIKNVDNIISNAYEDIITKYNMEVMAREYKKIYSSKCI